MLDQAGLLEGVDAAEHRGDQIAMLLGQRNQMQKRLYRRKALHFPICLAAGLQRAKHV
ncbi:hypothetical protein D3C71_2074810 [compost metagenome]